VDLAEAMRITAVAEGVETAGQLAGLRALGCHLGQGYLFSKPLPADEFDALLDREQASPTGLKADHERSDRPTLALGDAPRPAAVGVSGSPAR
jgi:predicted signal transduction protein with EAL and GGDEF domain